METMEETYVEELIASEEPEYVVGDEPSVQANYVVLCEEKCFEGFSNNIYEQRVRGETLADWVGRACPEKPIFLTLSSQENFLELVKPYVKNNEYTVVLFASTPLITKAHIKEMLGFAARKRLNVCRLKKGYILKNEYIAGVDEIFSSISYCINSNDFLEVKTPDDLGVVKEVLSKRMFNFHKKNGVIFENEKLTNLDANVQIGNGTQIFGGVSILSGSSIGEGSLIQEGSIISNSKIGENTIIETGAIVKNSIVKQGAVVEMAAAVNHSVVGEKSRVCLHSCLTNTALKENVKVGENCYLDNANVLKNAEIGKNSYVIGNGSVAVIEEGRTVQMCSKIVENKK